MTALNFLARFADDVEAVARRKAECVIAVDAILKRTPSNPTTTLEALHAEMTKQRLSDADPPRIDDLARAQAGLESLRTKDGRKLLLLQTAAVCMRMLEGEGDVC